MTNTQNGQNAQPTANADCSQLMVTMANTMAMQTAVSSIPVFDGGNIPLKDFIQDIRNAATDISQAQLPSFLKKVLSRLQGAARNSTYGLGFNSVDELVRHLKQRFAPGKTFTYYYTQLNDLRMKQGETVGDFRDRLNILLMGAENSLREDKGADYSDDMMVPIKGTAVDIFIRGLPGHLSAAIDATHPADLDAAFREAVRIESRIRSKILPEARSNHYHPHRYEDDELSANVSRNNPRYYAHHRPFPNQHNTYQPHRSSDGRNQQSSQPAFVGYMDQPENQHPGPQVYYDEPAGNLEPAGCEAPFVGYTVLNHGEPYGRYQGDMYPQADRTYPRNNNYQGANKDQGYQGHRGNYYNANSRYSNQYQNNQPNQYQKGYQNSRFPPRDRRDFDRRDPKLYYPAGPPLEPQPSYPLPSANQLSNQTHQTGHLNSNVARPENQEASQPIASMSSAQPNAQPNTTPSRIYVLQRNQRTGLLPVGRLREPRDEKMTPR